MFPNLLGKLREKQKRQNDLAISIGISLKTMNNKLTGKTEFTRIEMLKIKQFFNGEFTLEYLFYFETHQSTA